MKIAIPTFGDTIDSRSDHKSLIEVKTPEKTLNLISLKMRSVYVYSWT